MARPSRFTFSDAVCVCACVRRDKIYVCIWLEETARRSRGGGGESSARARRAGRRSSDHAWVEELNEKVKTKFFCPANAARIDG